MCKPAAGTPILCKSCQSKLAAIESGKIIIGQVNVVSSIEISPGWTDIKCRACGNWNMFIDGEQIINYKRKSEEVLNFKPGKR